MFSGILRQAARRLQNDSGIGVNEDTDLIDAVLDAHADVEGASVFAQFDLIVDVDTAPADRFELGTRHSELCVGSFQLVSREDQANDGAVKAKLGGEDAIIA